MLSEPRPWARDAACDLETSSIEFLVRDFYGPIIVFKLERYGGGEVIKAFPIEKRCENVEVSMSDLEVIEMACKELVEKFGTFELCLPHFFNIQIKNEEDIKTIWKKLLGIKLF